MATSLTNKEASVVLGMINRGDSEHDIAAWFGVNQGRIAEVKKGSHGSITPAAPTELPPKGPPGLKGRRLYGAVGNVLEILATRGAAGVADAVTSLQDAKKRYDTNEA